MLLLSRKVGQRIRIGASIIVEVCEIRGGQVRIGVLAPQEVSVLREEIFEAMAEANRAALVTTVPDTLNLVAGRKAGPKGAKDAAAARLLSTATSAAPEPKEEATQPQISRGPPTEGAGGSGDDDAQHRNGRRKVEATKDKKNPIGGSHADKD